MSRNIDFSKPLSQQDYEYVMQRQWLKRDAELQGFKVVLESKKDPSYAKVSALEVAEEQETLESEDEALDSSEELEDEDEIIVEEEEEEEEEESINLSSLTVAELLQEISLINSERDEDNQIIPVSKKKNDLIEAILSAEA